MKQLTSRITANHPICSDFYEMSFAWDVSVVSPLPGQFFTVRISLDSVPLLRRPFAFSGFDPRTSVASMIYQKRGRGTEILTGKRPGDMLDILGPLGNGFLIPERSAEPVLVAGGIGLGPILFLASALKTHHRNFRLIFGCRNSSLVPRTEAFHAFSPIICTDDGSTGFTGTTGDYLASIASSITPATMIYACGPHPMLRACHDMAQKKKCGCYVSVEQVMACGVGACMGCAVKMAGGGYKRACVEGPVFESKEIAW